MQKSYALSTADSHQNDHSEVDSSANPTATMSDDQLTLFGSKAKRPDEQRQIKTLVASICEQKVSVAPMRSDHAPPKSCAIQSRNVVRSALPWTGNEPPLTLSNHGGFFGMDSMQPSKFVHSLASGGTGTGKTQSKVVPVMAAMLRYTLPSTTGPKRAAMFIVDPKKELLPIVTNRLLGCGGLDRLAHLGKDASLPPVRFFEPNDGLNNREKLDRLNAVMRTADLAQGSSAYWQRAGLVLVQKFMNLEQEFQASTGASLMSCLVSKLNQIGRCGHFWPALMAVLNFCLCDESDHKKAAAGLETLLREAGLGEHPDAKVLSCYLGSEQNVQLHYRVQSVEPMLTLLSDHSISRLINLDPFPDAHQPHLDLRAELDAGRILLFQPEPVTSSEMAARALKTKVFEAVKTRSDMERPIGIVVDEFQKFVTCDAESGDATFLDTARAYRTNCVLATQSIGALLLALGSDHHAKSAVGAILANTPSKWFFGSKDTETTTELRSLIPKHNSGRHILDTRTLAQLRPGEAYWSLADGQWGRGRANLANLL